MSLRQFSIIAAIAALGIGLAGAATADYFWPGRVIIGTGILGMQSGEAPPTPMGNSCVVSPPIECECFAGLTLLEACMLGGADISCMTSDMVYTGVVQPDPVLLEDGTHMLHGLRCSGLSDQTAMVNLQKPMGPQQPPQQP